MVQVDRPTRLLSNLRWNRWTDVTFEKARAPENAVADRGKGETQNSQKFVANTFYIFKYQYSVVDSTYDNMASTNINPVSYIYHQLDSSLHNSIILLKYSAHSKGLLKPISIYIYTEKTNCLGETHHSNNLSCWVICWALAKLPKLFEPLHDVTTMCCGCNWRSPKK